MFNLILIGLGVAAIVLFEIRRKYKFKRGAEVVSKETLTVARFWREIEWICEADGEYSFEDHLDAASVPYCATDIAQDLGARLMLSSMNKFLRSLRRRGRNDLHARCMAYLRTEKSRRSLPDELWLHIDRI